MSSEKFTPHCFGGWEVQVQGTGAPILAGEGKEERDGEGKGESGAGERERTPSVPSSS